MIRKESPPAIDPSSPWDDDIFSRKGEGIILARLIANSSPGPITISLQSPWGSGKTVFLSRLAAELRNTHRVQTISIDAWKSDHHGDPLVPILATLTERMELILADPSLPERAKSEIGKSIKTIAEVGVKFVLPIAGLIANVIAPGSGIIATESAKIGERALKEQRERSNAEPDFRKALEAARDVIARRAKNGPIKPILMIIDELDRCRPDYAILMLERIKHYFDIPGILFLVSTDHGNLPSAVRTVYGSHVNGEEYLRKFFDYEFHLAPASHSALSEYLFRNIYPSDTAEHSIESLAKSRLRTGRAPTEVAFDKTEYTTYFSDLAHALHLSARDQVQAFTMLTAYLTTLPNRAAAVPIVDCFLVCLRFGAPDIYREASKTGRVLIPSGYHNGTDKLLAGLTRHNYDDILRIFFTSQGPDINFQSLAAYASQQLERHMQANRVGLVNHATALTVRRMLKSPNLTPRKYTLNVIRLTQAFHSPVEHEEDEAND